MTRILTAIALTAVGAGLSVASVSEFDRWSSLAMLVLGVVLLTYSWARASFRGVRYQAAIAMLRSRLARHDGDDKEARG